MHPLVIESRNRSQKGKMKGLSPNKKLGAFGLVIKTDVKGGVD